MSRALMFAAAITFAAPAFAETRYFARIDDLPMPPGFSETGVSAAFEAEEGRLVIASAEGVAQGVAVRDFYYDTLPQLGWAVSPRADGVLVFQRGREALSFTMERIAGERWRLGVRLVTTRAATDAD